MTAPAPDPLVYPQHFNFIGYSKFPSPLEYISKFFPHCLWYWAVYYCSVCQYYFEAPHIMITVEVRYNLARRKPFRPRRLTNESQHFSDHRWPSSRFGISNWLAIHDIWFAQSHGVGASTSYDIGGPVMKECQLGGNGNNNGVCRVSGLQTWLVDNPVCHLCPLVMRNTE